MIDFNPQSSNHWGRKMHPMELEDQRNKYSRQLHRSVRRILTDKRFCSLRRKANDLLDWETPEDRVNNLYKSPGFWILPPSNLTFFKCKFTSKSKFEGSYKIPFYLLLNEELNDFLRNSSEIIKQKIKLNEIYLKRERELQQEIDKIENDIHELCFDLYATVSQYAKYLIWAIDSADDIEDYELDLNKPYGKTNSIDQLEYSYYGAVFGSEFSIYEEVDFFVREKDKNQHIEILAKLKPLTKEFILLQITKDYFERGKYGGWEESKDLVREILEKIGSFDPITEHKVIEVIKEYSGHYNGPDGNGARLVNRNNGLLVKSNIAKALSDILSEKGISIGERRIRDGINNRDFELKCEYWN